MTVDISLQKEKRVRSLVQHLGFMLLPHKPPGQFYVILPSMNMDLNEWAHGMLNYIDHREEIPYLQLCGVRLGVM